MVWVGMQLSSLEESATRQISGLVAQPLSFCISSAGWTKPMQSISGSNPSVGYEEAVWGKEWAVPPPAWNGWGGVLTPSTKGGVRNDPMITRLGSLTRI